MAFLVNSNFHNGLQPWRAFNFAQNVATEVVKDGTAFTGNSFLRFQVSKAEGSVAADFSSLYATSVDPNTNTVLEWFPPSISAQVFLRSRPGLGQVSGTLAFWELGLPSNGVNNPNLAFTVGNTWTPLFLSMDRAGPISTNRIEIYLDTLNTALDIGLVLVT